jgi:Protein of unknown function (DUF4242)
LPRFLVESYPVGLTARELCAASERAVGVAAQMRVDGIEVVLLQSTLVPAEESLFCLFEAPSRHLVEEVVSRAGLPHERVVDAVDVGPEGGQ